MSSGQEDQERRESTMTQSLTIEIRTAIAAPIEQFMVAFSRGNAAGVAAVYTEDAQVLPPNSDVVSGKQAIQTLWQGAMNMGVTAVNLETGEAEQYGNTAYEVGRFTLQGAEGQMIDAGKYVVIWKQEGGQWKLHRDIWNSSRPAPGQ
jgi:uncharacterized protein (TIGR02246 family)